MILPTFSLCSAPACSPLVDHTAGEGWAGRLVGTWFMPVNVIAEGIAVSIVCVMEVEARGKWSTEYPEGNNDRELALSLEIGRREHTREDLETSGAQGVNTGRELLEQLVERKIELLGRLVKQILGTEMRDGEGMFEGKLV